MQDFILIPVSKHEFKQMIKECIEESLTNMSLAGVTTNQEKPMSVKEASDFLNLAPQTIYGFTSKNLIPFEKRGKKIYFHKSELLNWLKAGKSKTISETNQVAENYIRNSK